MGERGVRGNKHIRYIYHMLNCVRILFYVITGNRIEKFCPSSSLKYLPSSKGEKKRGRKRKKRKKSPLPKRWLPFQILRTCQECPTESTLSAHPPRTFIIPTRCLCLSEHPCRRLSTLKNGALNRREESS